MRDRNHVEEVFTYHAPDAAQVEAMTKVREALKAAAYVVFDNVPSCADRTVVLRLLREASMTANAAIVLKGLV